MFLIRFYNVIFYFTTIVHANTNINFFFFISSNYGLIEINNYLKKFCSYLFCLKKILFHILKIPFVFLNRPEDVPDDFLMPEENALTSDIVEGQLIKDLDGVVTFWNVVRAIISFDMGWSKRDGGRQYDSLNGYATIVGHNTGLVLDYTTKNRKCKACDYGVPIEMHDCRRNFYGSAKGMEPDAAVDLIAHSEILKELNMEVGVFVGDNDSSSIAAIRKACGHDVVKLSDKNHTSKGVTSALYNIQSKNDTGKELTSESIKYVSRCFTYAMAQNKGNSKSMANAVRNIPNHLFNIHDNCGDWCGYKKDPEHYDHSTIPGGFKNPKLFNVLKKTFDKLADNADSYAAGLSTNTNESLNGSMATKCPKRLCFSQSASADNRFAAVVAEKNLGTQYLQLALQKENIPVGHNLANHVVNSDKLVARRRINANTLEAKKKRLIQRQNRQQLRYHKEKREGVTYESNVGLFGETTYHDLITDAHDDSSVPHDNVNNTLLRNDNNVTDSSLASNCFNRTFEAITFNNTCLVFFDLETNSFHSDCDVLQIAMMSGDFSFNKYLQPSQPINPKASEANGLTKIGKDLFLNGQRVKTEPAVKVVQQLCEFLQAFGQPCVLIAHNCMFDAPRLTKLLVKTSQLENF